MISQSTRFNIGQTNSPDSSIKSLSYAALPGSPRIADNKKDKPKVDKINSEAGRHVFIPQKDDVVKHRFRLRYSPCSDQYYREWDDCVLSKVGGNIRHWKKGVYSFESVERIVDAKKNLVYLERTAGSNTGILTWKMDFRPCGLVIDQISIKVTSHNMDGGEVLVMLTSNETKKTISHMEGLGVVKVKGFENSNNLILIIHLIGESDQQKTRLFEKDILSKGDYPLDIKIMLKPPVDVYSKPVILLGLMFSNNQETSVDRRHYRSNSCGSGRGFLHINIVQGKNITSSHKDSAPDAQVKCYLLPDDKNIKSCKTGRAKKSSSPIWDEYFLIDGIAQSQLRKKKLGIRVVNWHLGINRKNTRLGELRIGSTEMFDLIALPSSGGPRSVPEVQTSNEEAMYSPLVRVDEDLQGKNKNSLLQISRGNDTKISVAINSQKCQQECNILPKGSSGLDLNDNQCSKPVDECDKLVDKNGQIGKSDEKIHVGSPSHRLDQQGTDKKTDSNSTTKEIPHASKKVKPKRPPLPDRLKLKVRNQTPPNKENHENKNLQFPDSQRTATTPTLFRLMARSPRLHSRRSSWGGESDLSLESPRSTQSLGANDCLESCQWDFMISQPKVWIYSWQTLEVDITE